MIAKLKRVICSKLAAMFSAWAGKGATSTPASAGPPSPGFDAASLPPFAGSAAEASTLWQLPPDAILKVKMITSVGRNGQIQDSIELIRLTSAGKTLARMDYLFVDDLGVVGLPEQLKGQCVACGRFSFRAFTCEKCGAMTCPAPECGGVFEDAGQRHLLCKTHLKQAEWNRVLWPPVQTKKPDSPNA